MIVLDASAAIEWLLRTPAGQSLSRQLLTHADTIHAPHLIDLEVTQVMRRYVLSGNVAADRAEMALRDFGDLRITRYPHTPLMDRVWQLRGNLTAYDGFYVALAERLDAVLITRDNRLAAAPGHSARVQLI